MPFDEIALRRATVDDAPALAIVGAGTTIETFAGLVDGQALLQHCARNHAVSSYLEYFAKPETQAWLAVVQPGDAPVGYILLTTPDLPLDDITPADIEIKRIYLFARFQGSGGGRLLLNQAVAAAKEAGKTRLLLGVNAENELALAFYYRNGFVKAGVRKFQVGDILCDDFILARPL
jgi:ribosomal protein S18 acetylase RimI-like enzyme